MNRLTVLTEVDEPPKIEELFALEHLHPYKLRHLLATHLLENDGDLLAVQELLVRAGLPTI